MFLSYGSRSRCCYAPIRLGKKKLKNSKKEVNVWICCKCQKKDVDIVEYTKSGSPVATVDTEDDDLVE